MIHTFLILKNTILLSFLNYIINIRYLFRIVQYKRKSRNLMNFISENTHQNTFILSDFATVGEPSQFRFRLSNHCAFENGGLAFRYERIGRKFDESWRRTRDECFFDLCSRSVQFLRNSNRWNILSLFIQRLNNYTRLKRV